LFQKTINISSAEKLDSIYTTYTVLQNSDNSINVSKPKVDFYPEGGDLIHNVKTRVGVKLNSDPTESIHGKIYDNNNNLISQFKTYHYGYGLFEITPDKNQTYTVKLTLNGQNFDYTLPPIRSSGINLNIINNHDNYIVQIKSSEDINRSNLNLVSHVRGNVLLVKDLKDYDLTKDLNLQIPKSSFPDGVIQFTLFDQQSNPICERLSFVENDIKEFDIQHSAKVADNNKSRSEVNLSLELKGLIDSIQNLQGKLSLAVVENTANDLLPSQTNIKSWMLLNSDLRGKIEDASYFFTEKNITKRDYILDIVLLTHGWRRFDWEVLKVPTYTHSNNTERQKGLFIKGQTTKTLKKKKGVKSKVNLVFFNNQFTEENVVTDENGIFEIGPLISLEPINAIIQYRKYSERRKDDKLAGKKALNIKLFSTQHYVSVKHKNNFYIKYENSKIDQSKYLEQAIYSENIYDQENMMAVELEEYVITAKSLEKEKEIDKISRRQSIYREPSNRLIPSEIDRAVSLSIFDLIRKVPGVRVSGAYPNVNVSIGGASSFLNNVPPIFLYNGALVDIDFIASVSTFDILFIDVLKGAQASIFGSRGSSGVIAIYTGNTNTQVKKDSPGIIDFQFNGFYKAAEFYSPDYSKDLAENAKPDYRSTLYWNPNLFLTQDEKVEIQFYTTDDPTSKYKVILEGVTDNGSLIYKEFDLEQ